MVVVEEVASGTKVGDWLVYGIIDPGGIELVRGFVCVVVGGRQVCGRLHRIKNTKIPKELKNTKIPKDLLSRFDDGK